MPVCLEALCRKQGIDSADSHSWQYCGWLAARCQEDTMEKQRKRTVGQGKYLTFNLGREINGIALLKVKEITELMPVAYVPWVPVSMEGVINRRGKFMPVVDVRQKCNMENVCYSERTCIIVIEMPAGKGTVAQVGIIVDAVSEVINIRKKAPKLRLPLAKKEPGMPC
jgi:chemotaxis signal transduction protein